MGQKKPNRAHCAGKHRTVNVQIIPLNMLLLKKKKNDFIALLIHSIPTESKMLCAFCAFNPFDNTPPGPASARIVIYNFD